MATLSPLVFTDINNQPRTEPSVSSLWRFDISTATRYVTINDCILMSYMEGGPANALVPYLDLHSLQSTYDPENLGILGSDLASYLKTPSFDLNVRGAYRVYVIRLGQPSGASLTLLDGAALQVLQLTSKDAGTYANKNSVEVASGTVVGKRLTFRFRQETVILNNLQNAFHLAYTGNAATGALTITRTGDVATRLQTTLSGASDGSIAMDLDLTQDAFSTIQQLVQYLNGQNGYRASIDPYGNALLPSAQLDAVASATIRTPVALVVHYVGAGTGCTMTTTNTALTTLVSGATGQNLNIDLTALTTDTLGEVVSYINSFTGIYTCQLGPNADRDAFAPSLLTNVAGQDIRTAAYSLLAQPGQMDYVVPAGLGSIVFAINTLVPRVSAARITGATTVPANIAQTFLAGGTNPVPTTADWLNALAVIDQQDLSGAMMLPVTTNPVFQDAVLAWAIEQHTNAGKPFRPFLAAPDYTSTEDAKAMATGFNSTYAEMMFQAVVSSSGVTEQSPLYPVAMYCGGAAGALPTQSLTRMTMRCRALPARAKYALFQREDLLNNGVCVLEEVRGVGVRIALAITTSLSSDRIDRMLSESMARDVIDQRIRAYVNPLIPHWAMNEYLATVKMSVIHALQTLQEDGIISTGRDLNGKIIPAWLPIQVSATAGKLKITVHVYIGGEIDHIDINGTIMYQEFNIEIDAGV